ncbi:methyl-accepting chemotaxis protein [Pantoea sp. B65]|uniref:methyl-accepting chemotaxis protein n=1 Tax=Pantoea sp. B65 TaxID=2813359 RepID=UPI0039B5B9BF
MLSIVRRSSVRLSSIRARILAITMGCVVIALIINTSINYFVAQKYNQQAISSTLDAVVSSHKTAIGDWINSKLTMIASLQSVALSEDPLPMFKQIASAGSFINVYAGYANKTAKFSSPGGIPADYNPTIRPWYIDAIRVGKPMVTAPYVDMATNKLVVSFVAPVNGNAAVVGSDVAMDSIVANVSSIRPTPASSGLLIDKQGTIVTTSDASMALKPVKNLIPDLDVAALIRADQPLLAHIDGVPKLLRAQAVAGTDWYLVVALDQQEATAGMKSLLGASALSLILLVLAAALMISLLIGALMRRLLNIRDAMLAISSGDDDLTQRLPENGHDEVTQIAVAFNAFIDKLATVMGQLRDASASVQLAANEIATGNKDLSGRTEQAAANLRETVSSIDAIAASVAHSTQSAADANQQVAAASETAQRGGKVVSSVISTMHDIENASAKIGDIISVIDGIAFQTNILALNAAVEAARAGEQGRGFAVVAGEVRSLAQRSAQAAKEIKTLIDTTTQSVASGSKYVQMAGETMVDIVTSVASVSGIMAGITQASDQQMQGIQGVNQAVGRLEEMVQQNAELVVESAAAAGALQFQANELAATAGHFRL